MVAFSTCLVIYSGSYYSYYFYYYRMLSPFLPMFIVGSIFLLLIRDAAMLMLFFMLFKLLITGGTFGSGSLEPKYKIEFHSEDSPFHPVSSVTSTLIGWA